uniref:Uncharacterized protein n=1 Tax=Oryza barthii TaxID=65489 RepID=A0A0D3GIP3_9ORYZ
MQGLPAAGHRPALGLVVVVVVILSSLRHAADPVEFNEPIHIVVAAPPQPPTQMQAGVNMSSKEDSGLPPTTSAFALTARLSCSTSRRRGASPRGSTLDQSPSAARVSNLSHSSSRK